MGYQTDSVNVVCVIVWNTNIVFCFSRMRSKGSRFTLGVWGLRVCSLDVAFMFAAGNLRNRSQPFVTVYRRAYGKFCKRGRFWRFHMWRCFVSRGRRGTSWHPDVFCNMSKVVLCGRRNTLDVSIFILRGRRSTLDVSCCVFFANRIVRAVSSGDKVQIPWQALHFVRCDDNWRKPPTKHWFWGCKFSGSKENS